MERRRSRAPVSLEESQHAITVGLERNANASNYLQWIEDLCMPFLGSRCLEIGAGRGDLTARFARGRERYVATDVSDYSLDALRSTLPEGSAVEVRELDAVDYEPGDERFDSIVMINVLEHIEDDRATLERLRTALDPGGRLILYVPAFQFLYSRFDREIGHYRRYRRAGLEQLLDETGFERLDSRYVNSIGALGWFVYCRLLRRSSSDDLTVGSCDRYVVPAARVYEDRWPPPFGLSLFCVARRA
jgi:SAM-dependent methyltransferase